MDIERFIELRPEWAYGPCLYIVKQTNAGHNAHRCGASGTHMYNQSDLQYGADRASLTGLLGRMTMYVNYWLPLKGTIFAALRVRKQLVADSTQRTGEDAQGNAYNIDRGNYTLVLAREKEFHAELDKRGLRWNKDKKNELFVPKKGVDELISALRTIRGEDMYLFRDGSIVEDTNYRGGSRTEVAIITETTARAQPERTARVPSITVRLSKASMEQLRAGNPTHFEQLLDLVRDYIESEKPDETITLEMDKSDIQEVRNNTERGRAITRGIQQIARRSPRLAALGGDNSTDTAVTRPHPRRSARLANKK